MSIRQPLRTFYKMLDVIPQLLNRKCGIPDLGW